MKTFKALYIDNGVIKANEFPVEPSVDNAFQLFLPEYKQYEEALASAKANAVVVVEDQTLAATLMNGIKNGEVFVLPSGWDYRVVKRCTNCERLGCESISCRDPYDGSMSYTQVAILYRTVEQPEPEESQEEIFDDLFSQYFKLLHEGHSMCNTGEILRERFTITRRK